MHIRMYVRACTYVTIQLHVVIIILFLCVHTYIHTYILGPSMPLNLRYENISAVSIRVFWDAPDQPNGVIEEYRLDITEVVTGIPRSTTSEPQSDFDNELVIDSLLEYERYTVVVTAATNRGFGNSSAPLEVLTLEHGM